MSQSRERTAGKSHKSTLNMPDRARDNKQLQWRYNKGLNSTWEDTHMDASLDVSASSYNYGNNPGVKTSACKYAHPHSRAREKQRSPPSVAICREVNYSIIMNGVIDPLAMRWLWSGLWWNSPHFWFASICGPPRCESTHSSTLMAFFFFPHMYTSLHLWLCLMSVATAVSLWSQLSQKGSHFHGLT